MQSSSKFQRDWSGVHNRFTQTGEKRRISGGLSSAPGEDQFGGFDLLFAAGAGQSNNRQPFRAAFLAKARRNRYQGAHLESKSLPAVGTIKTVAALHQFSMASGRSHGDEDAHIRGGFARVLTIGAPESFGGAAFACPYTLADSGLCRWTPSAIP